jgi:hypothetical protein
MFAGNGVSCDALQGVCVPCPDCTAQDISQEAYNGFGIVGRKNVGMVKPLVNIQTVKPVATTQSSSPWRNLGMKITSGVSTAPASRGTAARGGLFTPPSTPMATVVKPQAVDRQMWMNKFTGGNKKISTKETPRTTPTTTIEAAKQQHLHRRKRRINEEQETRRNDMMRFMPRG